MTSNIRVNLCPRKDFFDSDQWLALSELSSTVTAMIL
jgi:hypothetical protein